MIAPSEFQQLFEFMEKGYPHWRPEPGTTEVYYQILGDLPLDLLKSALLDYMSSKEKWPPPPGMWRDVAYKLIDEQNGDDNSAGEAWGEVLEVIRHHWFGGLAPLAGWNDDGSPNFEKFTADLFDDPLAYDALMAMGGPSVFMLPNEVEHTTRARFMATYDIIKQRHQHQARMLPEVRRVVQALAGGDRARLTGGDNERQPHTD